MLNVRKNSETKSEIGYWILVYCFNVFLSVSVLIDKVYEPLVEREEKTALVSIS